MTHVHTEQPARVRRIPPSLFDFSLLEKGRIPNELTADILGISAATVSRWRTGRARPSAEHERAVYALLRITRYALREGSLPIPQRMRDTLHVEQQRAAIVAVLRSHTRRV